MASNLLFGTSIHEPPLFNGKNYDVSKNMIESFIKYIDFELWYVIMDGPYKTLITNKVKTRERLKKS